jgi:acyl-homoserine lactone acylase PvdQ
MPTAENTPLVVPVLAQALLARPLEYIAADHERHRAVCEYLAKAAEAAAIDSVSAKRIARFLTDDLHHHFEDERLSLHPLLRQRSLGDDDFIHALLRIEEAHAISETAIDDISAELTHLSHQPTARLSDKFCASLREYALRERENLAFENAVIRVISEVRLKKSDIGRMSAEMKLRRGAAAS